VNNYDEIVIIHGDIRLEMEQLLNERYLMFRNATRFTIEVPRCEVSHQERSVPQSDLG
jgi:hypothetical protein